MKRRTSILINCFTCVLMGEAEYYQHAVIANVPHCSAAKVCETQVCQFPFKLLKPRKRSNPIVLFQPLREIWKKITILLSFCRSHAFLHLRSMDQWESNIRKSAFCFKFPTMAETKRNERNGAFYQICMVCSGKAYSRFTYLTQQQYLSCTWTSRSPVVRICGRKTTFSPGEWVTATMHLPEGGIENPPAARTIGADQSADWARAQLPNFRS